MFIQHHKTKEEAEKHCGPGEVVVLEGNAVPRYRVISKAALDAANAAAPFTGRECAIPPKIRGY